MQQHEKANALDKSNSNLNKLIIYVGAGIAFLTKAQSTLPCFSVGVQALHKST
jgi:hypothetical protein